MYKLLFVYSIIVTIMILWIIVTIVTTDKSIELSNVQLFTLHVIFYIGTKRSLRDSHRFLVLRSTATVPSRNVSWKLRSASCRQIRPKRWQKRERSSRSHKYVIYLYYEYDVIDLKS